MEIVFRCLHLRCYKNRAHSGWCHGVPTHWPKETIVSVGKRLAWSRFKKDISDAGLWLDCVPWHDVCYAVGKGCSGKDESAARLRRVGKHCSGSRLLSYISEREKGSSFTYVQPKADSDGTSWSRTNGSCAELRRVLRVLTFPSLRSVS